MSIFLVRRAGKLEAIFPFVLMREKQRGWSVRHLEFPEPNLEEAFVELYRSTGEAGS